MKCVHTRQRMTNNDNKNNKNKNIDTLLWHLSREPMKEISSLEKKNYQ